MKLSDANEISVELLDESDIGRTAIIVDGDLVDLARIGEDDETALENYKRRCPDTYDAVITLDVIEAD